MNNNSYYNDEVEVDLKQLMIYWIERAGRILLVGLLFAVLCGGYKFGKGMLQAQSDGDDQVIYEEALKNYEVEKEAYKKQKLVLEDAIAASQDYLANSIFMQINENAFYEADGVYYISAEKDKVSELMGAYLSILESNALTEYIHSHISSDVDTKYLKELVQVEEIQNDDARMKELANSGVFRVIVVANEEKLAGEIYQAVEDYLQEQEKKVTELIGEHSLKLVESSTGNSIDSTILEQQAANRTRVDAQQQSLKNLKTKEDGLEAPSSSDVGMGGVMKSAVKYVLIGLILGLFLAAGYDTLVFVMKDTLWDEESVSRRYRVPVLGSVVRFSGSGAITKLLAVLAGDHDRQKTEVEAYRFAAANLNSTLSGEKELGCIAVSGSQAALTEEAAAALRPLVKTDLLASGCILMDASAIEAMEQCEKVLLVEKKGQISYKKLAQQCEKLKQLKKDIVGIVLL